MSDSQTRSSRLDLASPGLIPIAATRPPSALTSTTVAGIDRPRRVASSRPVADSQSFTTRRSDVIVASLAPSSEKSARTAGVSQSLVRSTVAPDSDLSVSGSRMTSFPCPSTE